MHLREPLIVLNILVDTRERFHRLFNLTEFLLQLIWLHSARLTSYLLHIALFFLFSLAPRILIKPIFEVLAEGHSRRHNFNAVAVAI